MLISEYIYIAVIILLIGLLLACLVKLYRFSLILLELEDSIEESFDILDHHQKKMKSILEKPIFFDSVEIRQVVSDIRSCHNAVLVIANKLTSDSGFRSELKEEDYKAGPSTIEN